MEFGVTQRLVDYIYSNINKKSFLDIVNKYEAYLRLKERENHLNSQAKALQQKLFYIGRE